MKRITVMFCCLVVISSVTITAAPLQTEGNPATLPGDVNPDTRNRLPPITSNGPPHGAAAIRLHKSGVAVRFESPLGRALTELAILISAREHDAQYAWTLNEPVALTDGLEPAAIDQVRYRKSATAMPEREAVIIEFGRELFGRHNVSAETWARALKAYGERDLVDLVELTARHAADATLLTAFDQQLPAGVKPLLPIP